MDDLIRKIIEGAIDDMVYRDKPKDKHIRRMEKDLGPLTGFPIEKFKNLPPPPNESGETESEIEKLDSILVDDEFVESADNVDKHFENYLQSKDLEYPREEIKKYMAGVRSIILQLKYHYNRPRPGQIAQAKGMKGFDPESLKSASTPSYPSGHATQGRFIGRFLGDIYPEHKEQLIKIGDDIAYSRNMAKVHYPSDSKIGKKLGDELYDYISKKNINEQYDPCDPYTSEAPPAQIYLCTQGGCQSIDQPVINPSGCPQWAAQQYQGPGVGPPLLNSWFSTMAGCQSFCNKETDDVELVFDDEIDVTSNTATLSHKPDELVFDDEIDFVNSDVADWTHKPDEIIINNVDEDPCDDIPHYCCEKCENPNMSTQDPCYVYCECCDDNEEGFSQVRRRINKRVKEGDIESIINKQLEPLGNIGVKEVKNKYGIEVLEDAEYLYKKDKKMKKPIRIKESDIYRMVKRILNEQKFSEVDKVKLKEAANPCDGLNLTTSQYSDCLDNCCDSGVESCCDDLGTEEGKVIGGMGQTNYCCDTRKCPCDDPRHPNYDDMHPFGHDFGGKVDHSDREHTGRKKGIKKRGDRMRENSSNIKPGNRVKNRKYRR